MVRANHQNIPNRELAWLEEGSEEFSLYIKDMRWAQSWAVLNRREMMDRFSRICLTTPELRLKKKRL